MKVLYGVAIALFLGSGQLAMASHSHTFYRVRPLSQNLVLENALHTYDIYYKNAEREKKGCEPSTWWLMPTIAQFKGMNTSDFAPYFTPNGTSTIRVAQDNTSTISSPWLQIMNPVPTAASQPVARPLRESGMAHDSVSAELFDAPFSQASIPFASITTLNPASTVLASLILFRKNFKPVSVLGLSFTPWFQFLAPIVHVHQQMRVCEKLITPPGSPPGFPTVAAALNNPAWCIGRVSPCRLSLWGVDDIQIKLGADWIVQQRYHFSSYGIIFVPTGTASKGRFLWEPTIGYGPHLGLGQGIRGDYTFPFLGLGDLTLLSELRYVYFLKGVERRFFDLINGDWSSYLTVVDVEALQKGVVTGLPGINFFTRCFNVTPGGMVDVSLAFHYTRCHWNFEGGYSYSWVQKEKICIIPVDPTLAILDIAHPCPRTSASTATISAAVPGTLAPVSDASIIPINDPGDFDIASAAQPSRSSNTLYGALSYDFEWSTCVDGTLGLGFSHEYARNPGQSRKGIWFNTGIYF